MVVTASKRNQPGASKPEPVPDPHLGPGTIDVCCVFVCRDPRGRLLLQRRTATCRDEAGTWDCGGGKVAFGEDPLDALHREVAEEYGTRPLDVRQVGARSVVRGEGDSRSHWIALIFDVAVDPTTVRNAEPEKACDLGWYDRSRLPSPLHSQLLEHLALLDERRDQIWAPHGGEARSIRAAARRAVDALFSRLNARPRRQRPRSRYLA